ncbi:MULTISPECIES: S46 family peptidase [Amycolatopsis]|uniref:S46 family peptidase n=1 Tax=Amycolatopsis TaxID=1813 RepID=UPI001E53E00B|nr:S46 family peptidase [Amycolatopsis bullii]
MFAGALAVEPDRAELMLAAMLWMRADAIPRPPISRRAFNAGFDQQDVLTGRIFNRWRPTPLRDRLRRAGASRRVFLDVKTLLVPHANGGRYDLVVLDSGMPPSAEPIVVYFDLFEFTLERGRRISDAEARVLGRAGPRWYGSDIFDVFEEAMREVGRRREYAAIVVPAPAFVPMTVQPCLGIRTVGEEDAIGTVGMAAVTDVGEAVLTTARHAVADRTDLYVSGSLTSVIGSSEILDCALLAHPYQVHVDSPSGGVLDVPPRIQVFASFDGARSGPTKTMVRSFDMRIMSEVRNTALCVLTDADTAGGDSGAALYDGDGKLIGFCSERTELGAPFECTSWVWARQVLNMMRLEPSKE